MKPKINKPTGGVVLQLKQNKKTMKKKYNLEKTISGYWRIMEGKEIIFDDSTCEEMNGSREQAEAFLQQYIKELNKPYFMHFDKD